MSELRKPNVLLVDDNEATCTLIDALLQRDFDVDVMHDGNQAIERLRTKPYAAILLDLKMPRADGYAVLEFLRREHPSLLSRVLVVTAALGSAEMERVRKYDICGIVPKPFDVKSFLETVKQCSASTGAALASGLLSGGMFLLLAQLVLQHWM